MKSQWECLLQNLGEWHGSFTRLSPQGELLEDTPTVVSFIGLNENQTMRQIVRRYTPDRSTIADEKVLEYSSLNKGTLFFENGAFSQGSIQLAPFTEFGAELGLIAGDRRLRLVQLFDQSGNLDRLTLIREKLAQSTTPEKEPLQLADLLGEWQGEALTLYPDWRSPDTYPTRLKLHLEDDRLAQQLSFGNTGTERTLTSSAKIDGSRLYFDQNAPTTQVLLLPDKASSACPLSVKVGQPVYLEVGWLIEPHLRQRLIRSYNDKGEWTNLTLVTERKIS